MKLTNKKAFTLVELIVVITILAILGTIAFISLQGYSAEARDSRRISNINDLTKKLNIEVVRGISPEDLLVHGTPDASKRTSETVGTFDVDGLRKAAQGYTDFSKLRESHDNFMDPSKETQDYPLAYAIGGTGPGAYYLIQMAATMEASGFSKVVGNYYQIASDDDLSLIKTETSNTENNGFVVDGKAPIPYDL